MSDTGVDSSSSLDADAVDSPCVFCCCSACEGGADGAFSGSVFRSSSGRFLRNFLFLTGRKRGPAVSARSVMVDRCGLDEEICGVWILERERDRL